MHTSNSGQVHRMDLAQTSFTTIVIDGPELETRITVKCTRRSTYRDDGRDVDRLMSSNLVGEEISGR